MSDELTKEQLDEIEARCNAATPGPCEYWRGYMDTKEQIDKLEARYSTLFSSGISFVSIDNVQRVGIEEKLLMQLAGVDLPLLFAMARQCIELEARVKELEAEMQVLATCLGTRQEALFLTQDENYAQRVKIQELEAQAAAMKEAMICAQELLMFKDLYAVWNFRKPFEQALSGEAGKALLEKLQSRTELIADLADSLRDFGGDQEERRSSRYRYAAEALDRADALAGEVKSE